MSRIRVQVDLKNGYKFVDSDMYTTDKSFYLGNICLRNDLPNQILQKTDLYLNTELIKNYKLNSKNIDDFCDKFNENHDDYDQIFLDNLKKDNPIFKQIQPEYLKADWYINLEGKTILRFTVCMNDGYYFFRNNVRENSDPNYYQFYNQYEINVDDLVADDQLVVFGHKVDKGLIIGLSVGGGILLIGVIITVWSLYVYFHNKRRLERSRKED